MDDVRSKGVYSIPLISKEVIYTFTVSDSD